jgi:hypothetical protein
VEVGQRKESEKKSEKLAYGFMKRQGKRGGGIEEGEV